MPTRPFPRIVRQSRPGIVTGISSELSPRPAEDTAQIRDELIAWIADEALGGDHQAAQWVLMSCISRVFAVLICSLTYVSDTIYVPQTSPHSASPPIATCRLSVPIATPRAIDLAIRRCASPNTICGAQPAAAVVT